MSRPTILAASTAAAATAGWTRSVTSMAVPPVLRLALRRISTVGAGRRHRLGREPLIGQHRQGDRVELDLAQHGGVVLAAAGIGVDLLDQLGHAVDAVADDLSRLAAGGGHHPIAHHQQAIVVAGGELLDQHRRRLPSAPLRRRRRPARGSSGWWPRRGPGCRLAA